MAESESSNAQLTLDRPPGTGTPSLDITLAVEDLRCFPNREAIVVYVHQAFGVHLLPYMYCYIFPTASSMWPK